MSTLKQDVSLSYRMFDNGLVQILRSSELCTNTKILQTHVCLYILLYIRISTQVYLHVACSFLDFILTE